jgi:hypothetical protein
MIIPVVIVVKAINMVGYIQAPTDLDHILTYVENDTRFFGYADFTIWS